MFVELAFPHIRCCISAIPSELMKSTAVDESLSSMNQQFCSRENQLLQLVADVVLTRLVSVSSCCAWVAVLTSHSCSVDGPCRAFTFYEGLEEMVFFLLQQLWVKAYCFCSMVKGACHTVFGWNGVVAIPL